MLKSPSLITFSVYRVTHVSLFIRGHSGYTLYLSKLCYIFMEVRRASSIQKAAVTPVTYSSIKIFLFVLYYLRINSEHLIFSLFFPFATLRAGTNCLQCVHSYIPET